MRPAPATLALLLLFAGGLAHGFVRYLTAGGVPLRWVEPSLAIGVAPDPLAPLTLDAALDAMREAVATWTTIDCDPPEVSVAVAEDAALDPSDMRSNVIWFHDAAAWNQRFSVTELARTIVIHRTVSGAIVDADIAVNLGGFPFSAEPICVAAHFDLRGVLTHELGHFFGLDHSDVESATMTARIDPGGCELRTLDPDDIAGFCATYDRPEPVEPEPGPEPVEPVESIEPTDAIEPSAETTEAPGRSDDGCAGGLLDPFAGCALALSLFVRWRRRRRAPRASA